MATTQGKHIIPTKKQHNYLVGVGLDKTLVNLVGNDFAFKAEQDGKIIKIDKSKELVIIQYKDGSKAAIDISSKPAKNSQSGFYMKNKLNLLNDIKDGYSFKKNEILATNDSFFKKDFDGSHGFAAGRLTKVAVMTLPTTYEDSMPITSQVVEDLSSEILSEKQVAIKGNSNILEIVKEGQIVNINDPLIIFEEVDENDKEVLVKLQQLNRNITNQSAIDFLGKNIVKSKYQGTVTNIKIFYNIELEEMEPSLRKIVESYIKSNNDKVNMLKDIKTDQLIELPSTEKINADKIFGNEFFGVLFQFFISHIEKADIGSKITMFSAAKGIVSEVIPQNLAPYTDFDPAHPIEAIVSPMSLIARNVPDILLTGMSNRILIELKEKCRQILEE